MRTPVGRRMRRWGLGLAAACVAILGGLGTAAAQAPPAGTSVGAVDLRAVPGATPQAAGHAVPLAARSPDWYTRELHERVLDAGELPAQALPDLPLPSTVGIRPGSWMLFPAGCTMNFVFQSGGQLGIGTAGHCTDVGDEVTLLTLAPADGNPVLVNIGTTVVSQDNDIGDDFALVAIRPELNEWVFPTAALIAGPCGQFTGSGVDAVFHVGHLGGVPRIGLAANWQDDGYSWAGAGIFGDSGSPVRVTNLQAAGNFTHLVVDPDWLPGFLAGTRISRMAQLAGGWTMVNSAVC